jgi:transcriptional regulator with PAS, ATPase and Fis domain
MHNVLVFGPRKHIGAIRAAFPPDTTKLLFVSSLGEFKSIAFSRVFNLWVIYASSIAPDDPALAELLASATKPFIFFIGPAPNFINPAIMNEPGIHLVDPDEPASSWVQHYSELETDHQSEKRVSYLAGHLDAQPRVDTLITHSPPMRQLIDLVKDVAPTESSVLIYGETGTGKELLATILHNESRRRNGPFMAVNCGALPDTLLESELFGYEKGAFTGANGRRVGKIEHATGGTLFLDEVEAMSEAMQIRLLRVLQEKSLQRLGGNVEINTDFRLISATNVNPAKLLDSPGFRSDLYYRIAVFPVNLPPLRERTEDIPLLATHFVNRKKGDGRGYIQGIDHKAMQQLLRNPWPGNIRELQNVIERAVMLADKNMITSDLLDFSPPGSRDPVKEAGEETVAAFEPGVTLKDFKARSSSAAERTYLVELLHHTQGSIKESARLAGITPRGLYNKMKRYELRKEDFKLS